MTSWTEVINYVRTRYEVLEENDDWLRFQLAVEDSRSQQVSVQHVPDEQGPWIEISSPVGWAEQIDLGRLLELAGQSGVGGAGVVDGVALLKHTVPLADLNVLDEFERPLQLIVRRADSFEHELTKSDQF